MSGQQRAWVLALGSRYWRGNVGAANRLPLAEAVPTNQVDRWRFVDLPEWASDLGVNGRLLVPETAMTGAGFEVDAWRRCDWLDAAAAHLTGRFERRREEASGPIHSYAFHLEGVPDGLFDYAWVNRIFLFLRRWAAREAGAREYELLGPLPAPEIILTHDVDAIRKTPEIRIKQSAFHAWNAARAFRQGTVGEAFRMVGAGLRFGLAPARFHTLENVRREEERRGLRSILHFYAGPPGLARRSLGRLLIDPDYDIGDSYLRSELECLIKGGWTVGLHQSVASWRKAEDMKRERERLAEVAGIEPRHCRQHWLRFSWKETWRAQEAAGFLVDSTLGFNDRPGFRNGAALRLRPWDFEKLAPMTIETLPMVFMDSHFYDYRPMTADERLRHMNHWIDEIKTVRGQATVNWHTHTITDAYGWGEGYRQLLDMLAP